MTTSDPPPGPGAMARTGRLPRHRRPPIGLRRRTGDGSRGRPVTTHADLPKGVITYQQWLLNRIAEPGVICGPDVIDDRAWWQHLPGLNPYAELELRARKAERNSAARSRALDDSARQPEREAEAG